MRTRFSFLSHNEARPNMSAERSNRHSGTPAFPKPPVPNRGNGTVPFGGSLTRSPSTQSMFGQQVRSTRPSSSAFSFDRFETGRIGKCPDKLIRVEANIDPLYRGEGFNRHFIAATPEPGRYNHTVSMGKQILSRRRLAPSHGFGTTGRWAYLERQEKMTNQTPGPGAYTQG